MAKLKKLQRKVVEGVPDDPHEPPSHGPLAEWVDITLLRGFHKNPRMGDIEVVAESLYQNGQYKPIVVNRGSITGRTNEILAGNHTKMGAERLGWQKIYVTWVDVDDDQAGRIVLADNATADAGTYDDSLLTEIMGDIKQSSGSLVGTGYTDELMGKMLKQQQKDSAEFFAEDVGETAPDKQQKHVDEGDKSTIEDQDDNLGGVEELNNEVWFRSDEPYGIPPLNPNMCFSRLPHPLDTWGGHELDLDRVDDYYWLLQWAAGSAGITWSRAISYTFAPDEHFERMYTDPKTSTKKLINAQVMGAIAPDFTVDKSLPMATWIWAKYRSNYVARYWQEAGILVIPEIQFGAEDEGLDLALTGIPEGVPVAMQAQNHGGDMDRIRKRARLLREVEKRLEFPEIIVYGHKDADKLVDRANLKADVVRVQNRTARRREYLDSGSATINTTATGKKVLRKK